MNDDLSATWRIRNEAIRRIHMSYSGSEEALRVTWQGDQYTFQNTLSGGDVDFITAEDFLSCLNEVILTGRSLIPFEFSEIFYPASLQTDLPLDLHADVDFVWRKGKVGIKIQRERDRKTELTASALNGFCKSLN